jgi:hypothetical protein
MILFGSVPIGFEVLLQPLRIIPKGSKVEGDYSAAASGKWEVVAIARQF